jgi:hypothetical protein
LEGTEESKKGKRSTIDLLFSVTVCLVLAFFAIWGSVTGNQKLVEMAGYALFMILGYLLRSFYK